MKSVKFLLITTTSIQCVMFIYQAELQNRKRYPASIEKCPFYFIYIFCGITNREQKYYLKQLLQDNIGPSQQVSYDGNV